MATTDPDRDRDELSAALAARRGLGPDYEDAVLDSFLERVEGSIAARVDARVEERVGAPAGTESDGGSNRAFVLGIVSLGTGIPITAIAGDTAETGGIVVAWLGIAGVNAAHAWASRRQGRPSRR